jgi:DNA repair exonuclease SbcCD ATPase subunit
VKQAARLIRLELEAFRGFAEKRTLDLDADTILVRGDNGTGKTSITDGLLWLFTGGIPRLRDRGKGVRKEDADPIVSRYRHGEKARVGLAVRMDINSGEGAEAEVVDFERYGDSRRSTLRAWRDGEELDNAEQLLAAAFGDFTPDQFSHAVGAWGILQQHALLEALEGGASMHERLAEVVGLERVNRFAASAATVAKKARAEWKEAEQLRDRLREKRDAAALRLREARGRRVEPAASGPRISTLVESCTRDLPQGLGLRKSVKELEDLPGLLRELEGLEAAARALVAAGKELELASGAGTAAIMGVEKRLEKLKAQAEKAIERAPVQIQLADAALRMLGEECPVCGQQIDEGSVRQHLKEILAAAQEESERAADARRALAAAEAELQSARLAEARRNEAQEQIDLARERLRERIDEGAWVAIDPIWVSADPARKLAESLEWLSGKLRGAQVEGRRSGRERVVGFSTEVEATAGELERADTEADKARLMSERASALDDAAHQAAERIVERALKRLQPSLAEVFDRLSPHPTFGELQAKQDIYYRKNQVVPYAYDRKNEVGGHPALIFSEGQLNVVALSYFLGLALNAGDGALPFIVLDDTLAAMDVINVLGFADLCRRLREKRQLIVTTHDRRFAGLLARKLAPREDGSRTLLVELEGWTEEGPLVHSGEEEMAEIVPLPRRATS